MPLDIFSDDQRDLEAIAAARPAIAPPPTFSAVFDSAVRESRDYSNSLAEAGNRYDVVQRAIDAFETASGETLGNPEAAPFGATRDASYDAVRRRIADYAAANPRAGVSFPTDDEIAAGAVDIARQAIQQRQALEQLPQTWSSRAGGLLGDLWGTASDPLNIASMAAGAPAAAGILRTAAIEGAVAAGSQAAIEGLTSGFKQDVDPNYGLGDALANIAAAGAGGAVLGGGLKALVEGGRALFRDRRPPLATRDALNVAERDLSIDEGQPLPDAGAVGEAAHRSALVRAAADIEAGRPVNVEAEIAPAMRAADPLESPPAIDPEVVRIARETAPDVFQRLDAVEARLAAKDEEIRLAVQDIETRTPADAVMLVDEASGQRLRAIEEELARPETPARRRQTLQREATSILENLGEEAQLAQARFLIGAERRVRTLEAGRRAIRREARSIRQETNAAMTQAAERLGVPMRAPEPPPTRMAMQTDAPASAAPGPRLMATEAPTVARPPDEVQAAPEMPDATVQEALRTLRANIDMEIPTEVVDDALQFRRAADLMDEADAEVREADELAACAFAPAAQE